MSSSFSSRRRTAAHSASSAPVRCCDFSDIAENAWPVLNDRETAAGVNGLESCCAVIQIAGEHHADRAGAIIDRGRTEKRVGGRARKIFLRPCRQQQMVIVQQHMPIWRSDIYRPGGNRF